MGTGKDHSSPTLIEMETPARILPFLRYSFANNKVSPFLPTPVMKFGPALFNGGPALMAGPHDWVASSNSQYQISSSSLPPVLPAKPCRLKYNRFSSLVGIGPSSI